MKMPSFAYLFTNAKKSLVRFPLTIISSMIAVCLGIFLVEKGESIKNLFPYINILLTSSIGIPLFFSATVISNKKKLKKKENIILYFFVTIILVVIYFTFRAVAFIFFAQQFSILYFFAWQSFFFFQTIFPIERSMEQTV